MASKQDYYEILGVDRSADADTIKKAYRKLAMQYHPDRNPGDKSSEDKFKEAAEAYDVLSNDDKRSKYNQFGHQAFSQGMGGGGGYQDMGDIFSQFGDVFGDIFGQSQGGGRQNAGRTKNSTRRGSDLRYLFQVELKEVLTENSKEIEFETEEQCSDCTGTGGAKGSAPVVCKTCRGQGQVVRQQGFFTMATTCPTCSGQGESVENPCKPCRGQGRVKAKRKIKVTVPAGVDTGTRLRVSGEGEGGYRGGPAGDLFVELRVNDHDVFEREGDHLFANLDVNYLQFLLGGEEVVEALDGDVTVEIPRGSSPGDRIKIAGRGIPSLKGSRRGDLYYTINVEFPDKLSEQEEKQLREIATDLGTKVKPAKKGLFSR